MRLFQLGIAIDRIDALPLTHFHSDHSCVLVRVPATH
jgi:glyoxylase-like metal-dependent hydrolase (beta-lactamase superfamily II)